MIRHIVVFKLSAAQPDKRSEDAAEIASRLKDLVLLVPGILGINVFEDFGVISGHWEVILVADFENQASLDSYQAHPKHREVVAWINSVVADRAVIDFEVE